MEKEYMKQYPAYGYREHLMLNIAEVMEEQTSLWMKYF